VIVRRFAAESSRVWVTGRHAENIQQVAAKIIAFGDATAPSWT
jgi:NADP-dependent 3-hydroxy acid dehydrogenase YdfG